MIKRTRLAQSLLLCFSLSFVACNKDDDDKDKDKETDTDDDDKKKTKTTDDDSGDDDSGDDDSTTEDDKTSDEDDKTTEDDKTGEGDEAMVKARKVFDDNCKGCHGAAGAGKSTLKTEDMSSDEAKKWTDDHIIDSITDGIQGTTMQSFKDDLSEDEIKSLLGLIRCFQEKSDADECGKS